MRDIVIVGGGPAGLAAGLYAMRGGADAVLYEEMFCGGQATKTHRIDNYPGFPGGAEGIALTGAMTEQAESFGLPIEYASVERIEKTDGVFRLTVNGESVETRTVILALGATPRPLGIPREEELLGAGVSYCATCDGAFFRDKAVTVVGGGDTAIADALYLAKFASSVTVVHRRNALRAAKTLQDAAFREPKISFRWNKVAVAFEGEDQVEGLVLRDTVTGEETLLKTDGVFAAVGILPHSALAEGLCACTADGFIITDDRMRTDVAGLYAAGDVRTTPLRQVVTACADGAVAATEALAYIAAGSR